MPIATIVVLACWAICTALYHLGATGLFLAVRRDPEALMAGQVWRLVSPVLVQPDPLPSVIGLGVLAVVLVGAVVLSVITDIHGPAVLAGAVAGFFVVRSG